MASNDSENNENYFVVKCSLCELDHYLEIHLNKDEIDKANTGMLSQKVIAAGDFKHDTLKHEYKENYANLLLICNRINKKEIGDKIAGNYVLRGTSPRIIEMPEGYFLSREISEQKQDESLPSKPRKPFLLYEPNNDFISREEVPMLIDELRTHKGARTLGDYDFNHQGRKSNLQCILNEDKDISEEDGIINITFKTSQTPESMFLQVMSSVNLISFLDDEITNTKEHKGNVWSNVGDGYFVNVKNIKDAKKIKGKDDWVIDKNFAGRTSRIHLQEETNELAKGLIRIEKEDEESYFIMHEGEKYFIDIKNPQNSIRRLNIIKDHKGNEFLSDLDAELVIPHGTYKEGFSFKPKPNNNIKINLTGSRNEIGYFIEALTYLSAGSMIDSKGRINPKLLRAVYFNGKEDIVTKFTRKIFNFANKQGIKGKALRNAGQALKLIPGAAGFVGFLKYVSNNISSNETAEDIANLQKTINNLEGTKESLEQDLSSAEQTADSSSSVYDTLKDAEYGESTGTININGDEIELSEFAKQRTTAHDLIRANGLQVPDPAVNDALPEQIRNDPAFDIFVQGYDEMVKQHDVLEAANSTINSLSTQIDGIESQIGSITENELSPAQTELNQYNDNANISLGVFCSLLGFTAGATILAYNNSITKRTLGSNIGMPSIKDIKNLHNINLSFSSNTLPEGLETLVAGIDDLSLSDRSVNNARNSVYNVLRQILNDPSLINNEDNIIINNKSYNKINPMLESTINEAVSNEKKGIYLRGLDDSRIEIKKGIIMHDWEMGGMRRVVHNPLFNPVIAGFTALAYHNPITRPLLMNVHNPKLNPIVIGAKSFLNNRTRDAKKLADNKLKPGISKLKKSIRSYI